MPAYYPHEWWYNKEPKNHIEKCSKLYQQKYKEFLEIFQKTSSYEERRNLMINSEILLLPAFWNGNLKYDVTQKATSKQYKELMERVYFDFYSLSLYRQNQGAITTSFKKAAFNRILSAEYFGTRTTIRNYGYAILGKEICMDTLKNFISFPHARLKKALEAYQEFSGSFTTPEIFHLYRRSQEFFEKISAAKNDIKKWFECLIETNDDSFIIQNVEVRIAEEPTNKELWKIYIEFLKSKNTNAAQEVCYRYQHFFLEDDETFGFSTKIMTNKLPYPTNEYLDKAKFDPARDYYSMPLIKNKPTPMFFSSENCSQQYFPFKATFVNYILKNARPEILQRFYQSCKYFFAKIQKPLCHTFMIHGEAESTYLQNSLMLNAKNIGFKGISELFVAYEILVQIRTPQDDKAMYSLLSNVIPSLKLYDLRIIKIDYQIISTSDYNFLTKSGNIEKIVFRGRILDAKNVPITLEKIFKPLSKATDIELQTTVSITANSWKFLVGYKKMQKANFLYFPTCDSIDYFDFIEYLLHNCADDSHVVYPHCAKGIDMENGIRCFVEYAKQEDIKFFPKIDLVSYYSGMPRFKLFEPYL